MMMITVWRPRVEKTRSTKIRRSRFLKRNSARNKRRSWPMRASPSRSTWREMDPISLMKKATSKRKERKISTAMKVTTLAMKKTKMMLTKKSQARRNLVLSEQIHSDALSSSALTNAQLLGIIIKVTTRTELPKVCALLAAARQHNI